MATQFGIVLLIIGVFLACLLVFLRLFVMEFELGWPSLVVIMITGFGIQIFFFGIIGSLRGQHLPRVQTTSTVLRP